MEPRRSKLHIACSDFFSKSQSVLISLLLLSKSNPLRWASIWFSLIMKIDFDLLFHVGASFISLAPTFFQKSERAHAAAPPFRKRSRSARLLGCKRPRDGSQSLPTFCGLRGFNPHQRKDKKSFSCSLDKNRQTPCRSLAILLAFTFSRLCAILAAGTQ